MDQWLLVNATCPECRFSILPEGEADDEEEEEGGSGKVRSFDHSYVGRGRAGVVRNGGLGEEGGPRPPPTPPPPNSRPRTAVGASTRARSTPRAQKTTAVTPTRASYDRPSPIGIIHTRFLFACSTPRRGVVFCQGGLLGGVNRRRALRARAAPAATTREHPATCLSHSI